MSRVSALERLQTIDLEMDDKAKQARQVQEHLAGDPAVVAAHAAFDAAEKKLAELRAALRGREMEAQSLDAKIRATEERLYGGHVSNPKELEGLEKELQMFKRQRSGMDDQLLELMDAVEHAHRAVNAASGTLKQTEGGRADDVEHLTRKRDALASRLAGLAAERDSTLATLDAEALRVYDRLRQTKGGRAVAVIRSNACGVCGVSVPTGLVQRVQTGSEIVFCSGCGRILTR